MEIRFSKRFRKNYSKLNKNQQKGVDKAILTFIESPFHKNLKNHPLKGKREGVRSIDAGFDLRILFVEKQECDIKMLVIIMLAVGTHSELYG